MMTIVGIESAIYGHRFLRGAAWRSWTPAACKRCVNLVGETAYCTAELDKSAHGPW